ncbi:hypothetical protein [Nannocystis punicea]|uniref:Uncharacterized protein n=1 Tax=Nannocystis punicea TaxID=2995304 RepID=A0ABY7H737_9BACT|nr:hypothetical protein [Nannocystis poenicansa]WAS95084.1 hypothetical protein O0S08_02895 [Nannocystis poenicansa]
MVDAELIVKTMSTLPLQPGGGPSPASGISPRSGMPEPVLVELVEVLDPTELAESSAELVEVEVDVSALVELVAGGAVVMLELKPSSWPLSPWQAIRTKAARAAGRTRTHNSAGCGTCHELPNRVSCIQ